MTWSELRFWVVLLWMINQARVNGNVGCPNEKQCLYFTDGSSIKGVDVNLVYGEDRPSIYNVRDKASGSFAIDVDVKSKTIFWSEQSPNSRIRSIDMETGETKDLITEDVGEVEGIAVDSLHRKIYWTDFTYEKLEVANFDGTNRKTLFNKSSRHGIYGYRAILNPRGIIVHPTKGYIFWVDRGLSWPVYYQSIARSSLAGTDFDNIKFYTSWDDRKNFPMALTLDTTKDRLYVFDSYFTELQSINMNGHDVQTHHTSGHYPLPSEMTIMEDILYWADRSSRTIERLQITQTGDWRRMSSFGELSPDGFHGIAGYDNKTGLTGTTLCSVNNGNCSHLCLLSSPTSRICACPNGYDLLAHSTTNCSNVKNNFTAATPPDVQVRLQDGRWPSEGRVEVLYNSKWGTVCDDNFDMTEANVICRMLNYSRALAVDVNVKAGDFSSPVLLDELKCRGDEKSIAYCNHMGWGIHDCHHREDVGVKCDNGTKEDQIKYYYNATDIKVRLTSGEHPYEGTVEVYTQGVWGSICTDSRWTLKEAKVICRMAGYPDAWDAQTTSYFGYATVSKIWTSDVVCHGNETSIGQCKSAGWGIETTCNHFQDVSVTCKNTNDTSDIRLREGFTKSEGRVEIQVDGFWGWFCDNADWNITSAHVACKQLGFPKGALKAVKSSSIFGYGYGKSRYSAITCSGSEQRLQNCRLKPGQSSYCYSAGVICRENDVNNAVRNLSSYLLLADQMRNTIYQIDTQKNHMKHDVIIDAIDRVGHMDCDLMTQDLYVSKGNEIWKVDIFNATATLFLKEFGSIYDVQVDHFYKKLYFSMNYEYKIMVVNLDGSHLTQLLHVEYLMGMAVDIQGGYLYYILSSFPPKIYSAYMDGSNVKLVKSLKYFSSPSSLVFAKGQNQLYWFDSYDSQLMYLNLSSLASGVQNIQSSVVNYPYQLAILGNNLYWTQSNAGTSAGLFRLPLSGDKRHTAELLKSDFIQPNAIASCERTFVNESVNCECEFCLRTPSGPRCNCSNIQLYNETSKQCYTPDYLVFPDYVSETLTMIALDENLRKGNAKHTISIARSYLPDAVECDPLESRIYYADIHQSIIARIFFNGSSEEVIISTKDRIKYPRGLAIDHIGRNLYFTDNGYDTIRVSKLNGSDIKTLLYTAPARPTSIAIDHDSGFMYWGSWEIIGDDFKVGIHRSTMDGKDSVALKQWIAPYVYAPSQMTIYDNKLYWVGWHDDKIEYIELNTSFNSAYVHRIKGYESYLYAPNGIVVTSTNIYWTDEYQGGLYYGNHDGSAPAKKIVGDMYGIGGLKYCKGKAAPQKEHPCGNTNTCTHLCLSTPKGAYCACPDKAPSDGSCQSGLYTTAAPTTTQPPTTTVITTTTAKPTTTQPPPTTVIITTAKRTTTPLTTTAKPPTEPPTEFKGSCDPNPCENGGVCEIIRESESYKCKCPEYFVPLSSCSVNVGDGVIDLIISGRIAEEELWKYLNVLEEILQPTNEEEERRRRREVPTSSKGVKVYSVAPPDYNTPGQTKLEVAAVSQKPDGSLDAKAVLPSDTLEKKVEEKKTTFTKVLEKKFDKKVTVLQVKAAPVPKEGSAAQRRTGGLSGGATAGIVLAVIFLIVIGAVFLIYFVVFRRGNRYPVLQNQESIRRRPQGDMGTFSNPGFEVNPATFESPVKAGGSIAMSQTSTKYSAHDMIPVENPLYGNVESQGIKFTEKEPPQENAYDTVGPAPKVSSEDSRPQNQYESIGTALANVDPKRDSEAQYDNLQGVARGEKQEWEHFENVSETDGDQVSADHLALPPEKDAEGSLT